MAYTASGLRFGNPWSFGSLNDGNIAIGVGSDGNHAIAGNDVDDLVLTFEAGAVTVNGIAIYDGYVNRDTGTYPRPDGGVNVDA